MSVVRKVGWENLSDADLLKVRICDLGVKIQGTEIEPRIRQLYQELAGRGIRLRPKCYLSDEWQSPEGEPVIGIPFYLAHPRLKALEFRMMFEVEGGTPSSCMRLLRHETAHALDHAYRLHRREDWVDVFGSPRVPYNPLFYTADPHSKKHVRNLPDYYAQCHPAEDFAETFAVWLNPHSNWKTRYQGWPAVRKLRYVDRLMRETSGRRAPARPPRLMAEARKLRSTLDRYYRRRSRLSRFGDLSFAARDLRKIFRRSRATEPVDPAAAFVRRHKRHLVEAVHTWSGEHRTHASTVVAGLAKIADEHNLVLRDDPDTTLVRLSTYVATLIVNRLHTHSYWLKKK